MKTFTIILLFILFSVSANAQKKKVLIIGWDGVRSDCLSPTSQTPYMDSLFDTGIFSTYAYNQNVTVSGPTWSTILTGVWQEKHGVFNNSYTGSDFYTYPYFTKHVKEQKPDLYCVHICSWSPMTENVYNHGFDNMIVPTHADNYCSLAAQAQLANPNLDVLFVHFDGPDAAGHEYGFSPSAYGYIASIENCDYWTGQLLNALQERADYENEDWLIISMTDHGGIGYSHGGTSDSETRVWIPFSSKTFPKFEVPGIAGSHASDTLPRLTDIAVTALDHLGIEIDSAWNLDGRSLYDLYSISQSSVNEVDPGKNLSVFPNPATDQISVDLSAFENEFVEVTISNLMGNEIMNWNGKNKNLLMLNIGYQAPGIYLLTVCGKRFFCHKQIVVQ